MTLKSEVILQECARVAINYKTDKLSVEIYK
jgi:hypothetical protein